MKPSHLKRMRRKALEEWRGLPEPPAKPDRTRSMGESVPQFLTALGLKDRFDADEMMRSWKEVAGDFVAEHSQPVKVEGRILYVRVLQPTLHYDLERTLKKKLLERVQARFGSRKISNIRFTLG